MSPPRPLLPVLWRRILFFAVFVGTAQSTGFIGCMYSSVCLLSEQCVNDGIFGRCVSSYDEASNLISGGELSADRLRQLIGQLEILLLQGHRWHEVYTQCVLQSQLLTLTDGWRGDAEVCELVNDLPVLDAAPRRLPVLSQLTDSQSQSVSDDSLAESDSQSHYQPPSHDPLTDSKAYGALSQVNSWSLPADPADWPLIYPDLSPPSVLDAPTRTHERRIPVKDELNAPSSMRAQRTVIMKRSTPPREKADPFHRLLAPHPDNILDKYDSRDLGDTLLQDVPDGRPYLHAIQPADAMHSNSDMDGVFLQDSVEPAQEDYDRTLDLGPTLDFHNVPELDTEELSSDKDLVIYPNAVQDIFYASSGINETPVLAELEDSDEGMYKAYDGGLMDRAAPYSEESIGNSEFSAEDSSDSDDWVLPLPDYSKGPWSISRDQADDMSGPGQQQIGVEDGGELNLDEFADARPLPTDSMENEYQLSGMDVFGRYPDNVGASEFTRAERLDVKKPGPWFGINNFAFDYDFDGDPPDLRQAKFSPDMDILPLPFIASDFKPVLSDLVSTDDNLVNETTDNTAQITTDAAREPAEHESVSSPSVLHKFNSNFFPKFENEEEGNYEIVITFNEKLNVSADHILRSLEKVLDIPVGAFNNFRMAANQVVFTIDTHKSSLNTRSTTNMLDESRDVIGRKLGLHVTSVHLQDKEGGVQVEAASPGGHHRRGLLVPILLAVLVLASAAAAGVAACLCLHRRRLLANKTADEGGDTETTTQHYQELCRSRMAAGKKAGDKPASGGRLKDKVMAGTRGQVASRDSDVSAPSPTSRSSTSSWCGRYEEPVTSNMDISTGHMVLSYMEDHLNNKDKLDKEWAALCQYEADPCSTTVATLPTNAAKNGSHQQVPYDHCRVLLNAAANSSDSDYINASSVTDHDPRSPAFIVTQGVLANTVVDFWQMVWEQGCVVIVLLTRLTESGTAMCHRYWPEEGSELYHIYEVHLVSEHIWCDDYLVRSFYLKNQKTGETRTVTQFHYLAWPDQGVPVSAKSLLDFRRKVNKSYRGRSCPMIVQCSDGSGRAGTYCLIDMVLARMAKGAKEIDIAASLEHLRDQRAAVVSARPQFEFVLMAIADEVHAIVEALP